MGRNDYQKIDPQRNALETRIKKIDEQIVLLNTIKNQSLAKLQSLPQITAQQPIR